MAMWLCFSSPVPNCPHVPAPSPLSVRPQRRFAVYAQNDFIFVTKVILFNPSLWFTAKVIPKKWPERSPSCAQGDPLPRFSWDKLVGTAADRQGPSSQSGAPESGGPTHAARKGSDWACDHTGDGVLVAARFLPQRRAHFFKLEEKPKLERCFFHSFFSICPTIDNRARTTSCRTKSIYSTRMIPKNLEISHEISRSEMKLWKKCQKVLHTYPSYGFLKPVAPRDRCQAPICVPKSPAPVGTSETKGLLVKVVAILNFMKFLSYKVLVETYF